MKFMKLKGTSNVDEAIESTNEFTALIEALKKADESLEYVIEFLADLMFAIFHNLQ